MRDNALEHFIQLAHKELVPKMQDSQFVVAIAPGEGDYDLHAAIEIGLCILMGKPLIVLAPDGRVHPEKLLRIADHVIRGDMETEAGRAAMFERMERILKQ